MVFKSAYFVEFTKGYQPSKSQFCRLYGSSITEGLQKHNDDVMMTPFNTFWIQTCFCKTSYKLQRAKFQILQLFESNFTEVFIRHPKYYYDVIMRSFHNIRLSKLHIL